MVGNTAAALRELEGPSLETSIYKTCDGPVCNVLPLAVMLEGKLYYYLEEINENWLLISCTSRAIFETG